MLIFTPKGSITPSQKWKLEENGSIVIECNDPDNIRIVNSVTPEITNEWFLAALEAIAASHSSAQAELFVKNLWKRLKENTDTPQPQEK